jgi:hypothetical protein
MDMNLDIQLKCILLLITQCGSEGTAMLAWISSRRLDKA